MRDTPEPLLHKPRMALTQDAAPKLQDAEAPSPHESSKWSRGPPPWLAAPKSSPSVQSQKWLKRPPPAKPAPCCEPSDSPEAAALQPDTGGERGVANCSTDGDVPDEP